MSNKISERQYIIDAIMDRAKILIDNDKEIETVYNELLRADTITLINHLIDFTELAAKQTEMRSIFQSLKNNTWKNENNTWKNENNT